MAMGGSITDTTQASTRYTPSTRAPWSQSGAFRAAKRPVSRSWPQNRASERRAEGTLAPSMVSHKMPVRRRSMTGIPVARLVKSRSSRRSRRAASARRQATTLPAISAPVRTNAATMASRTCSRLQPAACNPSSVSSNAPPASRSDVRSRPRHSVRLAIREGSPSNSRRATHRDGSRPPRAGSSSSASRAAAASMGAG